MLFIAFITPWRIHTVFLFSVQKSNTPIFVISKYYILILFCKLRVAGGEDADRGGCGVRRPLAALPWNAGLQLVRHDV